MSEMLVIIICLVCLIISGSLLYHELSKQHPEWEMCRNLDSCWDNCLAQTNWTAKPYWNNSDNEMQHFCFDECGGNSC